MSQARVITHRQVMSCLLRDRRVRDYLKEQLKDPAFRNAYEEEGIYADWRSRWLGSESRSG